MALYAGCDGSFIKTIFSNFILCIYYEQLISMCVTKLARNIKQNVHEMNKKNNISVKCEPNSACNYQIENDLSSETQFDHNKAV